MRASNRLAAVSIILLSSACASVQQAEPGGPTPAAWGALLNTTDFLANAGRHAAVDSTLLAFERGHPGTRAADEVLFWRALYKLDPRSSAATRAEGRALLNAYVASPTTSWYRAQANVLRHLAQELTAAEPGPADTIFVAGDTSAGAVAARDRMIRTQRAEIARLNAELERIKRRLATPTP